MAISPDRAQVASGGWTGGNVSGQLTICIFDRATGALAYRIEGLPNVTPHPACAPDGQRLAANFGESNGLQAYCVTKASL